MNRFMLNITEGEKFVITVAGAEGQPIYGVLENGIVSVWRTDGEDGEWSDE